MPKYSYLAQAIDGTVQKGTMSGESPQEVQRALAQRDSRLVGIQDVQNDVVGLRDRFSSIGAAGFRSIRSADIELMLQQLSVMLKSGLSLAPSLRELSVHCPKRKMQLLCTQLADAIEQGSPFAEAIVESKSFPPIVAQLAQIGEDSGELPVTLQRAAQFVEKRRRATGSLLATLAYPLLVAVAAGSVAIYLVGWGIPKVAALLDAMGRKLPSMTQSLLDGAAMLQVHGPLLVAMAVTATIALVLAYFWQPGRYRIDQLLLRVPLVGPLLSMAASQQLAGCLSLLLRSGVFLQDALETAAKLQKNQYLAGEVQRSRRQVSMGNNLAGSLHGRGFAPLLSSMIAVGEQTGDLAKTLDHVDEFYADQVESQIKRLEKLIEPTIIVVVGGIVGYVYMAFSMALMSAGGNFK